jgi:hypothetical protein
MSMSRRLHHAGAVQTRVGVEILLRHVLGAERLILHLAEAAKLQQEAIEMLRENLDDDLALQLPVLLLVRAAGGDVTTILRRVGGDPLDCIVKFDDLELDLRVAD